MTTIYVDADACPVKDEVTAIAIRHGCRAVMVCNGGIRPNPHPLIDLVIVDDGPDAADIWIAGTVAAGDIVVTNDIPLAAKCVASDSRVLRPDAPTANSAGKTSSLFNGKDLAGWHDDIPHRDKNPDAPATFIVRDGNRSFGDRSFGDRSFGDRKFGDRGGDRAGFGGQRNSRSRYER